MRCEIHCPSHADGVAGTLAAVVLAVVAVVVLWEAAVVLAVVAAAGVLLAFASVPLARRARVLCVPRGSAFHARYRAIARPPKRKAPRVRRPAPVPLAIEAPRLALEAAPLPGVTVTLSAADYVRVDHQDQATGSTNKAQQMRQRSTGQA